MNFFVLLSFLYLATIFLIVAIPILLATLWGLNRWVLKRRLRLVYKILLSFGIPVLLVVLAFIDLYYTPYSTSNMDNRLALLIPEIKLPQYKITEYSSVYVGGDDLKDTYQITFKNGKDESLKRSLDSLVNSNNKWKKIDGVYVYDPTFFEDEIVDSIIVRPLEGKATFVRYKW